MKVTLTNWHGTKKDLAELIIILQINASRTNTVIELEVNGKKWTVKSDENLKECIDYILG